MARMTDLAMAAGETDPGAFQESFEEIGMNIEDPTLFNETAVARHDGNVEPNQSILQEAFNSRSNNEKAALISQPELTPGETSEPAEDNADKLITVDGTWIISIKSPLGAQTVSLRFSSRGNRFSGTMVSKLGSGDISDGIIVGNQLKWSSTIERPRHAKLEFSAKIDGDSISGVAKMGTFIQTAFKGKRN